jgi:hypothetical protein
MADEVAELGDIVVASRVRRQSVKEQPYRCMMKSIDL